MSQGEIEFSFGSLGFSGEGEEKWLAEQLDKVIKAVPELSQVKPPEGKDVAGDIVNDVVDSATKFTTSLSNHIKDKDGGNSQVIRFLATADWLRRRGRKTMKTADVTRALSDNHQAKLSNPAERLNQNVGKGFCEKKGSEFFITPEGLVSLGYS